jgi:hypothetical protein
MSIGSISSLASSAAQHLKPHPAASTSQPAQPAQAPHFQHHHAGGSRGEGALTAGKLTSAGMTPVLDTLV